MAKGDSGKGQQDAAEEPKKSKLPLIIGAVVVVLIAAGAGMYFMGMFGGGDAAGADPVPEQMTAATYYPLEPKFIVNYNVNGVQRYMQLSLSVKTYDEGVLSALDIHKPSIRNKLLMLFSRQKFSELQTDEGRQLLRELALSAIQEVLQAEIGQPGVDEVYFTNLVMQ